MHTEHGKQDLFHIFIVFVEIHKKYFIPLQMNALINLIKEEAGINYYPKRTEVLPSNPSN